MCNQHPIVFITPNPIMLYPYQKASHSVTYTIRSYCFFIYIPNPSFYTLIKELHIVLHMRLAFYCFYIYIYIYSIPSFYIPIKELHIVLRMRLASYCFFIYIFIPNPVILYSNHGLHCLYFCSICQFHLFVLW